MNEQKKSSFFVSLLIWGEAEQILAKSQDCEPFIIHPTDVLYLISHLNHWQASEHWTSKQGGMKQKKHRATSVVLVFDAMFVA